MTKEEAMDLLDNLIGMVEDSQDNDYDEALKMAIEALERTSNAHPTHECVEPTHECVSRQAAADFSEWNPEIISLETKTIKYYDEDEKVWKIGEVIIKQDALDILDDFQKDIENGVDSYGEHRDRLMNLPDINVGKSEDNNSYIQELRKNVESLCGNCDRPGKEELGWLILSAMEKGYELGLGSQCNVDGIAVEPVGNSDTLRPKGKWIYSHDEMILICDQCGERFNIDDIDSALDFMDNAHFCINCGAEMRGEQNE